MKKVIFSILILSVSLFASGLDNGSLRDFNQIDIGKDKLVFNCIQPIKPIKPIKPVWCSGTWTQILRCDQNCNCIWEAVCLQ